MKSFKCQKAPSSTLNTTALHSYKCIPGFEKKLIKMLINLNIYHKKINFKSNLTSNILFEKFDNFFIKPILPDEHDMFLLKNLYILKLLAARSYRAIRMSARRPVHGQRRWSNAKMARRCNTFLYYLTREYEIDLFNYGQATKFKWTPAWEMRQKAKMRKKVNKRKKWGKFRKFGERRLAEKKRKKTPWN